MSELNANEKVAMVWESEFLLMLRVWHSPFLDSFFRCITFLGDGVVIALISAALLVWCLWQRDKRAGIVVIVSGFMVHGVIFALKGLFGRARPHLWTLDMVHTSPSFPSGHATSTVLMFGLLAYLLCRKFPHARTMIIFFSWVLIFLTGFSRLYLGVHWPTDVVAGWGVGYVLLLFAIRIIKLGSSQRSTTS